MSLGSRKRPRLAVLIDAENIGVKHVGSLFEEIAKRGTATARRIYGDWTRPDMASWRGVLHEYALIPVQQFRLSKGKNCVDCALIVDAMDLLYTGRFDGFCIVSSDGDFTRLASRLRESGLLVHGFGETKTPEAFAKSCDEFITLAAVAPPKPAPASSANGAASASRLEFDETQRALVKAAYLAGAGEDGWVDLGLFGDRILRLSPSFKPRAFGRGNLSGFVEACGLFKIKKVPSKKNPAHLTWRIKWRGEINRP